MMDGDFIILHSIGFDKVLLISRMRSFRIVANAGSGQQQNVQVNYNNFIILLFKDHGCPDIGHKNGSALLKAAELSTRSSGPDRLNKDGLCPVNHIKGYTENIGNYAPMGESLDTNGISIGFHMINKLKRGLIIYQMVASLLLLVGSKVLMGSTEQ